MMLFEPHEPDDRPPLHSKTFERERERERDGPAFLLRICSGSHRYYLSAEFFG